MKNIKRILLSVFMSLFICIGAFATPKVYFVSADISESNLETTMISEDLSDIDIALYPKDENGTFQVIRFQEYCYSEKPFYSQYYGLYVYLYNPTEREIHIGKSSVEMAIEYDAKGDPVEYSKLKLKICDKTANNRFYKFKILDGLSEVKLLTMAQSYAAAHEGKRRYDISSFELYNMDGSGNVNAIDGKFAQTYIYTGYAASCGAYQTSTLSATVQSMATLELKPHATTYRPEGHNDVNEYTQDSLHSVWFSVPNEVIEQYGEMTAVKATWLNAVLAPALVTGNQDAYNAILNFLGDDLGEVVSGDNTGAGSGTGGGGGGARSVAPLSESETLQYGYLGVANHVQVGNTINFVWQYGYSFNLASLLNYSSLFLAEKEFYGQNANPLYLLFNSGAAENSADNYIVSPSEIKSKAIEISNTLDGEKLVGAEGEYSKAIFESIDEEYTTLEVKSDDTFDLTNTVVGSSWWDKLWGIEHTSTFDGIKGIDAVTSEHIALSDEELSSTLYVSLSDVSALREEYAAKAETHTIYLLRYMVSDYFAQEATLLEEGSTLGIPEVHKVDTNAYFFQETVNLDFDIIEVKCTKYGVETIIPVVSNPIDIFPEATPPIETTPDNNDDILGLILKILLFLLFGSFFSPIISFVISAFFFILKYVFVAIGVILKWAFKIIVWLCVLPFRIVYGIIYGIAWVLFPGVRNNE